MFVEATGKSATSWKMTTRADPDRLAAALRTEGARWAANSKRGAHVFTTRTVSVTIKDARDEKRFVGRRRRRARPRHLAGRCWPSCTGRTSDKRRARQTAGNSPGRQPTAPAHCVLLARVEAAGQRQRRRGLGRIRRRTAGAPTTSAYLATDAGERPAKEGHWEKLGLQKGRT